MDWDLEDRLLSVGRTILDLVAAAEARRRRFRVRESEARVIREIAERILAGESSSSIVRDLNARKVPTRGASTARRRQAIQVVVSNPRYAGLRVLRGQVFGPAAWPALITVDQHEAVVAHAEQTRLARASKRDVRRADSPALP
jgi:site-specific DNA recombinase